MWPLSALKKDIASIFLVEPGSLAFGAWFTSSRSLVHRLSEPGSLAFGAWWSLVHELSGPGSRDSVAVAVAVAETESEA